MKDILKNIIDTITGKKELKKKITILEEHNELLESIIKGEEVIDKFQRGELERLEEELEKYRSMGIDDKLISIASDIIDILPKTSDYVIRKPKEHCIEIRKIGVDARECLCDGDLVNQISVS